MKRCGVSRPMHSKSLDTAAGVAIRKRVNNIGDDSIEEGGGKSGREERAKRKERDGRRTVLNERMRGRTRRGRRRGWKSKKQERRKRMNPEENKSTRNEWTDGGEREVERRGRKKKKTRQMGQSGGKKREGEMDRPRSSTESEECASLGAFTRAKRDVGEPCVSK